MIMKPSLRLMFWLPLTKMKGNTPTMKVTMQPTARGRKPESNPSCMEMHMLMNIKRELTSKAMPTFLDMALRFTVAQTVFEVLVLIHEFRNGCIELLQFVVTLETATVAYIIVAVGFQVLEHA